MSNATVDVNQLVKRAWIVSGKVFTKNFQLKSTVTVEEVFVNADTQETDRLFFNKYDAAVAAKNIYFDGLRERLEFIEKHLESLSVRIRLMFKPDVKRKVRMLHDEIKFRLSNRYDIKSSDILNDCIAHIDVKTIEHTLKTRVPILAAGVKLYTVNTCYGVDGIKFEEHEIIKHDVNSTNMFSEHATVRYETNTGRRFDPWDINSDRGSGILYERVFDSRAAAEAYARECAQTIYNSVKQWL